MEPIIEANDTKVCTCNDEFATTFCPVHPPEAKGVAPKYGSVDKLIITDADMSKQGYGFFEGYIFTCPSCRLDAIMVNPTMGKRCTNCGIDVDVRSKTVTDRIRKLTFGKAK